MLSVAKLTPGQERYYQRSVAQGLDDYFAGRGESPGIWTGRGAQQLGLAGVVEEEQLGQLVRGIDPGTGNRLRRHPKVREITVERIDPASDERRIETKKLSPVAGFGLVFSCPKSVSLLHALGDEATRMAVNRAHEAAWQAALRYLEDVACVTRRGRGGVVREHAGGFVAAAYQHRTSRAQDPQLHTHVIVANMAMSPDGKWRALDGEPIIRTYRLAAGYLYQTHLRAELARTLGVEWERPVKGMAEMRGVPSRVLTEFSRRRVQIVEHMAERDDDGWYAAQVASIETRERKEHVDLPRLREDWRARAAEHGFGRRELEAVSHRKTWSEPGPGRLLGIAHEMLGPKGLTERRTAFSEPELVMAWAEAHDQGTSAARVLALSRRFVVLDGIERVGAPREPGRPARYSTAELIRVERNTLALVERGHDCGAPAVPSEAIAGMIRKQAGPLALSVEQEAMLHTVATSPHRVVAVVGLAGAGKTTATHAVGRAFNTVGIPVLGAAPSGVAAERLQDEAGIRSMTLHRLLSQASKKGGLPEGCVLIVDEVGMAETRILAPVLERVEQAGGKAILIGDPHQLPAVGAGGLLQAIVERYGAVELTENRRQRDELERAALTAVRAGLGRDWLAYAERRGRLVVTGDPLTTRIRLLADWWTEARSDPAANVMIALRRRDVAELNSLGRALMEVQGMLGRARLTAAGHEFAVGDRIVCLRNNDPIGVKNGTRGTVESLDRAHRSLRVLTDRGDRVDLPEPYLEASHVRHAYALTGHSGQGVTVEHAFVLGRDEARLREWGYVALSRARDGTTLYVTRAPRETDHDELEIEQVDPVARFTQALEESAVERLAVDQAPAPAGPKHEMWAEIDRPASTPALKERLRGLEQQRRFVTDSRRVAEGRIAQRKQELARLGWHGRRRRSDAIKREVAFQQRVLETADRKLATLDRLAVATRHETEHERSPGDPSPRRDRERSRERHPEHVGMEVDLGL